jgi:hypothetical protein
MQCREGDPSTAGQDGGRLGLNICCICQADGVLIANNAWYCINHVDDAFVATAVAVTRILGHNEDKALTNARKWVKKL